MERALGTSCDFVESQEVETLNGEVALQISVKTDEEHSLSTSIVLSRKAQIALFHQLNNSLFKRG